MWSVINFEVFDIFLSDGVSAPFWDHFWSLLGCFLGFLGLSWEPLGASWGDLGPSWSEIGWSWGDFLVTSIFDYFLERFWEQKACPRGGILGAQTEQKSIKKRGANLRAKKSPLGVVLVRFWVDFSLVFKAFREHSLFWRNIVSRAVLSPTWPILDRFWPPKWLQNGSQNGSKTMKKSC